MHRGALFIILFAVVCPTASASAPGTPEQQLAAKYAPVVALKEQSGDCDSGGEPYRPVPADVVLGRSDVTLVDSQGTLVKKAPTASDLFSASDEDYLDFPGDPLDPGCSYEQWADEISRGAPTTAYAHIVTQPGKPRKLALQ